MKRLITVFIAVILLSMGMSCVSEGLEAATAVKAAGAEATAAARVTGSKKKKKKKASEDTPKPHIIPKEPRRLKRRTDIPIPIKHKETKPDFHTCFGSSKGVHGQILKEYSDQSHAAFCAKVAENLNKGKKRIVMGPWLSLDAGVVEAIQTCASDIGVKYEGDAIKFHFLIPAGTNLKKYADKNGCVCVACLAEDLGATSSK